MRFAEEVSKAMLEVAKLSQAVSKTSPDSILFRNELIKMSEEGLSLFAQARKLDDLTQNNPHTGIPQHHKDDILREIQLVRNNVQHLYDVLNVTRRYASTVEKPNADSFQTVYSSSEGTQTWSMSPCSTTQITPKVNQPSSSDTSPCGCLGCKPSGMSDFHLTPGSNYSSGGLTSIPSIASSPCDSAYSSLSSGYPSSRSSGYQAWTSNSRR